MGRGGRFGALEGVTDFFGEGPGIDVLIEAIALAEGRDGCAAGLPSSAEAAE